MPSNPRALIVEDDRDLCQLIDVILTRQGMTCRSALSVAEALTEVRGSQYDAILLDLAMPTVSGFDFLKVMSEETPELLPRIVVVTGLSPEECEEVDEQSIHAIIRKPFAVEELVRSVTECVGKSQASRSLIPKDSSTMKGSTTKGSRRKRKPPTAEEPNPYI